MMLSQDCAVNRFLKSLEPTGLQILIKVLLASVIHRQLRINIKRAVKDRILWLFFLLFLLLFFFSPACLFVSQIKILGI